MAEKGHDLDYATRRAENAALNAAVRMARCLFLARLLPAYASAGFLVPPSASQATMLPEPWLPPKEADDAGLIAAWRKLRKTDPHLWIAVGLARFAGLRREEIVRCRGGWVERRSQAVTISLRDRPEEGWQTKTGKPYRAIVLHRVVARFLTNLHKEAPALAVPLDAQRKWFNKRVGEWLRPFVGDARKPLHRLRGLYADQLARETEEAILAKSAGVKKAQKALGHTTSRTTEKHYISKD